MPAVRPLILPPELLRLSAESADELLDDLERRVPVNPPLVQLPESTAAEAVVFGDSHGDWRSTEEVVGRYRDGNRILVGLGDYIDRPPDDCGEGSVANALYLLQLSADQPGRVILIQGNHEAARRIPVLPHHLPSEIDELWGPDSTRYDRLLGLFERGPFAVATANGAYLAHAGFPKGALPDPWTNAFQRLDEDHLSEIVWAECDASRLRRGAATPWTSRDLDRFLESTGLHIMLRGHDPDVVGRPLYGGRCLTLHTTRIYERYGGVLVAEVPLNSPLEDVRQLRVTHLSTEGRSFPAPT